MNSTEGAYRMDPAEDMLLRGDQLADGMWVLAEVDAYRAPFGASEDDRIRSQRFRQVSGLRRKPPANFAGAPERIAFTGTWVDGHQRTHTAPVDEEWIVKNAPAPEVTAVISEGDLTRHAETIREALRLAQDTAPSAAAALRGSRRH